MIKSANIREYFKWVVCINLRRRPERWNRLLRHLEECHWPFRMPERFDAIDASATGVPCWWRGPTGAWGCLRSHLAIIERALNEQRHPVLILEDDALLCDDFEARAKGVLETLPHDWGQFYFGGRLRGQNAHATTKINDQIISPASVLLTHAYALRGEYLTGLYHYLSYAGADRIRCRDVDQQMAVYHQTHREGLYAPSRWLIGQYAGFSDVAQRRVARTPSWQGVNDHVMRTTASAAGDVLSTRIAKDGLPRGWFSHKEGEIYRREVATVKAGVIVEVGTWLGRSTVFILDICRQKGNTIYCVDTWAGSASDETSDMARRFDVYDAFVKNMSQYGAGEYLRPTKGNSVTVAKRFDDRSIDLVMIDGDHAYESVRDDIEAWLPKIRPGGTIMGHDYDNKRWPGVTRAVRERWPDVRHEQRLWIKKL